MDRARRRLAWLALGVVAMALVVLGGTAKYVVPWLEKPREEIVSTPGVPALFQRKVISLDPGQTACIGELRFTPEVREARFRVFTGFDPSPPITVETRAPGYRANTVVRGYASGVDAPVTATLPPPARQVDGDLCISLPSGGRRGIGIVGTDEARSLVLPSISIDGRERTDADVELTLLTGDEAGLFARRGDLVEHAASLASIPEWAVRAAVWLAAVLLLAGSVLAFGLAALRDARGYGHRWRRRPAAPGTPAAPGAPNVPESGP